MSRYSKMSRLAKAGAVDSKYFNNIDQFEKDVKAKIEKTNEFKRKLRELILDDPNLIEQRCNNAVSVILEIKQEFL